MTQTQQNLGSMHKFRESLGNLSGFHSAVRTSPIHTPSTQRIAKRQHPQVLFFVVVTMFLLLTGCVVPADLPAGTIAVVGQQGAVPIIAVAPLEVGAATQVSVTGSGWQADDTIGLWAEAGDRSETVGIATVSTDADGNFSVAFQYPPTALFAAARQSASSNQVFMVARSTTTSDVASMPFEIDELTTGSGAASTGSSSSSSTSSAGSSTSSSTAASEPTATYAPPTITPVPLQAGSAINPGTDVAVVTSPGLNIRSGPSAGYPVRKDVLFGAQLVVLGQSANGSWLRVQSSDGTVGWVARFFTTYQGSPVVVAPLGPPPTQIATATPITIITEPITDWRGEYFANRDLSGAPVRVSNDANIDFNWGEGGPSGLPSDNFSIRWTRTAEFDSDDYRFRLRMDDGARLFVDDNLVIDDWRDNSARDAYGDIYLGSGTHTIRVEYYEHTGAAEAHVWWERRPDEVRTDNDDDDFPQWKGEYFTNRDLDGNPRFRRNDQQINFNWGTGSPSSRIPDHDFSVRWSRWIYFEAGLYRLNARSDDGVRVYVNGDRVINEWDDNSADQVFSVERYLDGGTDFRVDYFERRGAARIEFWWDRIDEAPQPTATPVPSTAVPATAVPATEVPPTAIPPTATSTPIPVQPSANVQPSSGGFGTTLIVNGGAFPPETVVNVHLAALAGVQAAGANQEVYASTTTDRTGSYSVSFPMPENWINGGSIPSGKILVLVATNGFGVQASDDFDYVAAQPTATPVDTPIPTATPLPTDTPLPPSVATATPIPQPFVTINPGAGGPDTLVTVTGGGFPGNTPIGLYLGLFDGVVDPGNPAANFTSTQTDINGNYTMSFTMPGVVGDGIVIPSGNIIVLVATNGLELQTSAIFAYTAADE